MQSHALDSGHHWYLDLADPSSFCSVGGSAVIVHHSSTQEHSAKRE